MPTAEKVKEALETFRGEINKDHQCIQLLELMVKSV